ncbi:hypothetical protein Mapa_006282 [Marchantia paleacea]|nr:hypothetical protein Mapa_006282 [Marchantia paleacea]
MCELRCRSHSHRPATNTVMATINLVATVAGKKPDAADTPVGAGAGASAARATPTLETATAAIRNLATADLIMIEAILSVCERRDERVGLSKRVDAVMSLLVKKATDRLLSAGGSHSPTFP